MLHPLRSAALLGAPGPMAPVLSPPQERGERGQLGPRSPGWRRDQLPPPSRTPILTPAVRLLQAQREKEEGLVLCGRVTFPCEPGQGRVHKLVVTPELFRQIQSYFIS